MRKLCRAAVSATLCSAAILGCTLLVDTTGLAGEPVEDAADDRATSVDSGPDTTPAGDANEAGPTCEASFCDDFDRTPLGDTWTTKVVARGGVIELGTPAQSQPNALRARFLTTGMTSATAALERNLGRGSRVHCDFSMFIESPPKTEFIDVFRLHTNGPGLSGYDLLLGIPSGSGGATFREDVGYDDGGCGCPRKDLQPPAVPTSRWVRITVDTDFVTASLSFDGSLVSAGALGGFKPSSDISVAVGSWAYMLQTSVVLFDDFSCTITP